MAIVPSGIVQRAQLDAEIAEAITKLRKDEVVHVAYSLAPDATDDPSIFFRITLTDEASQEQRLADVTSRVSTTLFDEINPLGNWGLNAYFNFRSQTGQLRRNDPEWS